MPVVRKVYKPSPSHQKFLDILTEQNRKNFKFGTVPGAGNSKINYDPDTNTYRKRVQETIDGKKINKYIYSEPGQTLENFKKIKPVRSTGAEDATVKARQYIDSWTKNWFDNNLKNYGVRDFEMMLNDLSNDWDKVVESGNVPKGKGSFNLSTSKLKLPNITSGRDVKMKRGGIQPFNYNDVTFYANLEGSKDQLSRTLSQYKKVFYKNKIETNPQLRSGLNNFFEFMSRDKRGEYRKLDGKTIKEYMKTVDDDVKFLLDPEASGLGQDSKNRVFNAYDDLADNYNKFTEDKVRLKAVQAETEAIAKAGKKTAAQYEKVKADIAKQNDVLAKMSVKDIANNKELLNSVRLSINPKTGEVSYTNYTVNNPKGKTMSKSVKLTDLELAKYIKQKAKDKNFYVTEHIGKKSFNKANLAYPNNIQSANYMSNSQLENARRFLINPENRNTPAAQNLDKTLEDLRLTIRGPEYGSKPIGNKIDIIFDQKTNRSSIVDNQLIKGSSEINELLKIDGVKRTSEIDRPKSASERDMFKKASDRFKNSQRGSIDVELLEDIAKGAKKATDVTLKTVKPIAKGLPFSAVFEFPFIPGYQEEGYNPKEIATQMLTGGMGIPFKDIQEKARYVRERGLGSALTDAFNKKMALQNIRPSRGLSEDFGKEPEMSRDEKLALKLYYDNAQDIINSRRKIQADKYKRLEEMTDIDDEMFRDGAMNGGIMKLLKNE